MAKITGYLVDVEHNIAAPVTIEKSLDSYYGILNCDCIDITTRQIGNREYDIICDDEGLFKDDPKISAIDSEGNAMLCGNLFIVKFDGIEDETSLDPDDIAHIEEYIRAIATKRYPIPYPMLTCCEY